MKTRWFMAAFGIGLGCLAALAQGTPKIQFEKTVCDFGKVIQVESVSGAFKFKNVGEGVLKLEPPVSSCGCTVAALKSDTLKPGESGELTFTLNLGRSKTQMEKHISVTSNDPETRVVLLAIKVDYTPLFDLNPMTLALDLPLGTDVTHQFTTLTRTDGKPLRITKMEPSKPWITARLEPNPKADDSTARIRVEIQRDGSPRRFNEYIQVHAAEPSNGPASLIYVYGQMMGEVSISPELLYWSFADAEKIQTDRPPAMITRNLTIRSATGKPFQITNPRSTLQGIKLEFVPKEAGRLYELIARLEEVPKTSVNGSVSFETSVASQSRIEIPLMVHVFKP